MDICIYVALNASNILNTKEEMKILKEKEDKERVMVHATMHSAVERVRYDNDSKNRCPKGGSHTITMKGNPYGSGWGECTKCGKRF